MKKLWRAEFWRAGGVSLPIGLNHWPRIAIGRLTPPARRRQRRGAALVMALVTLLVVMLVAGTTLRSLVAAHRQARRHEDALQAEWLAEAALARGLAKLRGAADYAGETWRVEISPEHAGVAEIRVHAADASHSIQVQVEARYPDHPARRAVVSRQRAADPAEETP